MCRRFDPGPGHCENIKVPPHVERIEFELRLKAETEKFDALTVEAERAIVLQECRSARQMHGVLMNSVRGADKTPGQFRVTQNWIGVGNCPIEQATFVPPSPLQLLDHLEAFERYLAVDDVDPLVQAAVVHAQFELLHPFNDGNGRIGRLLIPLFLFQKRVLASPMFYLTRSHYALKVLDALFDRNTVQRTWDKLPACQYLVQAMVKLRYRLTSWKLIPRSLNGIVFDRPIFESSDFVNRSGIPKHTALPFLRKLREVGVLILLREKSGRRSAILAFSELLNCAEGRKIL